MPRSTDGLIEFGRVRRCRLEADFSSGDLSSDGGMMLLKRADERIGLTRAAAVIIDSRDPSRITHQLHTLLA